MSTYKWFRRGTLDPETGSAWSSSSGQWTRMSSWRGSDSHAIGVGGLAYEPNEELWEVELRDVLGFEPFPEQAEHVSAAEMLRGSEQRIRAHAGRPLRRVDTWTPEVAEAFTFELAARSRDRALQALQDAATLLSAASDPTDDDGNGTAHVSLDHEAAVLLHTERILHIWRLALTSAASLGALRPTDAGRAAALTREVAALTYASANVVGDGSDPRAAAASAYLGSRRWQSAWLADRLGLDAEDHDGLSDDEGGLQAPATRPGIAIDVLRDLGRLQPEARKRILAVLREAHERAERSELEASTLRAASSRPTRRRRFLPGRRVTGSVR